jgi:hypothetical protein
MPHYMVLPRLAVENHILASLKQALGLKMLLFDLKNNYAEFHASLADPANQVEARRQGLALVLRNVWAWIHFRFAKRKYGAKAQLFLELLRFQAMLLWIAQVVRQALGADKTIGLDRNTYERLTAHCRRWPNLELLKLPNMAQSPCGRVNAGSRQCKTESREDMLVNMDGNLLVLCDCPCKVYKEPRPLSNIKIHQKICESSANTTS